MLVEYNGQEKRGGNFIARCKNCAYLSLPRLHLTLQSYNLLKMSHLIEIRDYFSDYLIAVNMLCKNIIVMQSITF